MPHRPLCLTGLSLVFPHKTCFADVKIDLRQGQKIALIGKNGAGKSSLLALLLSKIEHDADGLIVRLVPQIHAKTALSGAELFMDKLLHALDEEPSILILDEPTNHLDRDNRRRLMRILKNFSNTVIIATHDIELLQENFDIIWHLDNGKLNTYNGSYQNYIIMLEREKNAIESELKEISKSQKLMHKALMQEQTRAKNSRRLGEKNIERRKWPTVVSSAKARRAEQTSGKKQLGIKTRREEIINRLDELKQAEIIMPKFHFLSKNKGDLLVSLQNAFVGYNYPIIKNLNLTIRFGERVAIIGKNGSGKSTLMKGLINHPDVQRAGRWHMPADIGYLDQNYLNLDDEKTIFQLLSEIRPDWKISEIRCHLNDFLFRKNEEIMTQIKYLSGGERARLSLALIAANSPRILLLDEITNNIDLDTKNHLLSALRCYDGAIVVISHDMDFLHKLDIQRTLEIK